MKIAWPFCLLFATVFATSCDRKPFVEHKLSFEKTEDDCSKVKNTFSLNSNFGGERYLFDQCLPADFNKDQLVTERKGDTVLVKFVHTKPATNVFQITLDIDSYPKYRFLKIGNEVYTIVAADK